MKKYIKPIVKIVSVANEELLAGSGDTPGVGDAYKTGNHTARSKGLFGDDDWD